MKNILYNTYDRIRCFSVIFLFLISFISNAHTVNIYLINETPDTIFATQDRSTVIIKPGTQELIGSQEREPVHEEHEHTQPGLLRKEYLLNFFKLEKTITISVTTSSALLHTLPIVDSNLIGRDKLEWTVTSPSDAGAACLSYDKSHSYYYFDKKYQSDMKAYSIIGEKKGIDLHALPAADLYFTVKESA